MAKERNNLPEDAVKINGKYIEDYVTGYKTIKAVGREVIDRDLTATETMNDGAILRNVRYTPREITIEFAVARSSVADMRASMDTLKSFLDVKEAQFIFNGDYSYYFVGTPVLDTDFDDVKNGFAGSFVITCTDPFKYSTTETVVPLTAGSTTSINYKGTYKSYPTIVTQFANSEDADGDSTSTNECGFVGFVNQREKILQFGDPDETDWADVSYPATVPVNKSFKANTGWPVNGSQVLTGTQVGSFMNVSPAGQKSYTYPGTYSTGTNYHGPSLSYLITGETPPIGKNFNFTWSQKFTASATQFGGFECILWHNESGTRTMVGALRLIKKTRDQRCDMYFYVGSTTAVYHTTDWCRNIGTWSMKKIGGRIDFESKYFNMGWTNTAIENLVANEITFHFMKNGTKSEMDKNYLYSCKLQRFAFDNYEDVKNIFAPGDVLTVDTSDAAVYLDEGSATIPATYLGALGNDWEEFYLVPGTNVIGTDYSDFTTDAPTFTLKYRERYI